jgi:dTDP-glucose 4,6-dehydratase
MKSQNYTRLVLEAGQLGETYNVGGWNEKPNIEIVKMFVLCLTNLVPASMASPMLNKSLM